MYKEIKLNDIDSIDGILGYKLCYIDDIPLTDLDYTAESKKLMESEHYKKEQERIRKIENDEMEKYGYCASHYYENRFNSMIQMETVQNPQYIFGEASHFAYFTPLDLNMQWGDDWNDAPYEYNAEIPYDTIYNDMGKDKEVTILKVPFYLPCLDHSFSGLSACTPKDYGGGYNSPFSVELINMGAIPWIFFCLYRNADLGIEKTTGISIMAGENPIEFREKLQKMTDLLDKWSKVYDYNIEEDIREQIEEARKKQY